MSVPPEIAWLIPVVIPFVIGLLIGAIIKRTISVLLLVIALIAILAFTGYISLSVESLYEKATKYLPKISSQTETLKNLLPYTSISFIIGLAIGLWKG
ncbi:MAG: hypothetical protein QXX33_01435 [Candidatus Hadarchaeales archaeon]